jgi:cell division protein FtsL
VLIPALAAVFGLSYWHGYQLNREAVQTERERDALRRQNAQLREEIRQLHRPEYVERIAREQLGLVRPDEIAIIVVRPTPAPRVTAAPGRDSDTERGPWWRLRNRDRDRR